MAFQDKKFLDAEGITHLVRLLDEYPNNQVLGSVIDAIEGELEGKAEKSEIPEVPVQDVQVNNSSILNNGIANIPISNGDTYGLVRQASNSSNSAVGITNDGVVYLQTTTEGIHKAGTTSNRALLLNHLDWGAFYGLAKAAGDTTQSQSSNAVGTYTNEAKVAIQNMLDVPAKADIPNVPVQDVQVNNTSILNNGVATIPIANGGNNFGVIKVLNGYAIGIAYDSSIANGTLRISPASSNDIKIGGAIYMPITAIHQHESTFYGLAKAAGDTTQSTSSNTVGTYTNEAKQAIQQMLGVDTTTVNVTGTTPTITAQSNHRYICGEVTSIDFTPCTYGICELMFTSGSTLAVLTLPSTVKMPEWFEVETEKIYDIIITDGVYGAVMSWEM